MIDQNKKYYLWMGDAINASVRLDGLPGVVVWFEDEKAARRTAMSVYHHLDANIFGKGSFTRSNGGVVSRLYERLTKASRREQLVDTSSVLLGKAYRQGIYDAYKALQEELS